MSTNGLTTAQNAIIDHPPTGSSGPPAPEQLSLLPAPGIPVQFRLDERTRRSGLQHVAQLREQIAAQAASRPVRPGRTRVVTGVSSPRVAA